MARTRGKRSTRQGGSVTVACVYTANREIVSEYSPDAETISLPVFHCAPEELAHVHVKAGGTINPAQYESIVYHADVTLPVYCNKDEINRAFDTAEDICKDRVERAIDRVVGK